jgi:hypothetical protein
MKIPRRKTLISAGRQFLIVIYINDRILWRFIYFNFTHVGIFLFPPSIFFALLLSSSFCFFRHHKNVCLEIFLPSPRCVLPPRHKHSHTPLSPCVLRMESINISFFMRVTFFALSLSIAASYFCEFLENWPLL